MTSARDIEAQRIADYMRGWNDAARGRKPRSQSLTYVIGFMDASR